jgi:hypothetical protein
MYADAYIRKIRAEVESRRAQRAAEAAAQITDPRAALRAQIAEWQRTLPPGAREHGYLLEEIRKVIHATPQRLGLALDELGWHRKRVWLSDGPFRRYWFPPDQ